MLVLIGLAVLAAHSAAAGGDSTVTVNSPANTDDGACEGPPNDDQNGDCTLREAILEVNAGHAGVIKFHPPAFAEQQPGVIGLCADGSAGELPPITRDVIIDATGSAVVLDGGSKDIDCLVPAASGIAVSPQQDGLDFTLIGGQSFWIRDLGCLAASATSGGIVVGPIGFSAFHALGTIEISGVIIGNVCGQGILIVGSNVERLAVIDSDISSNERAGVQLNVDPCLGALDCELRDSTLDIRGNRLRAGEHRPAAGAASHAIQRWAGISANYTGALNGTILANISQNELLSGTADGVQFNFLGCGVDSEISLHIDENVELSGGDLNGVEVSLLANACIAGAGGTAGGVQGPNGGTSRNLDIVVSVNGNGNVESRGINLDGGQGVDIGVAICCEEGGSSATVEVNGNTRIKGEFDGVNVHSSICCGNGNLSDVSVSGNDEIVGEGDEGVDLVASAGDGDDNACVLTVDGNGAIDGVGAAAGSPYGVWAECFAGALETTSGGPAGAPSSSGNRASVFVTNNDGIEGDRDGIIVLMGAGSAAGTGDGNLVTVDVSGNGEVTGDHGDSLQLELHPGSPAELTVTDNRFAGSAEDGIKIVGGTFADEAAGIKSVIWNNIIDGNGDDGIDIESASGLNIGPGNQIFQNGTDAGGNGIEIDWCLGGAAWSSTGDKLRANGNRITRNSIYDNAGLGIDLVGWDADGAPNCAGAVALDGEGVVGCAPFPDTAISPNDCIPFPDVVTQAGDKLIGTACPLCTVEVFRADAADGDAPGVAHGEGVEYLASGDADEAGDFSILLPCGLAEGLLTATATDGLKNTSEFSANLLSPGTSGGCTVTPVPTDTAAMPPTDTPVAPTPTPTPEPPKLCGDPNEDGAVNAIDATLILQLNAGLLGSLANESSADVNGDGDVTSVDATLILQVIAGLLSEGALNCG
ncbi:MAG: hypothetical protein IIB22_07220 [Chloroflexi bacterium]|nr:hypothetical protein [Chloroflexota bacterium]